jgi:hypothetical protein
MGFTSKRGVVVGNEFNINLVVAALLETDLKRAPAKEGKETQVGS